MVHVHWATHQTDPPKAQRIAPKHSCLPASQHRKKECRTLTLTCYAGQLLLWKHRRPAQQNQRTKAHSVIPRTQEAGANPCRGVGAKAAAATASDRRCLSASVWQHIPAGDSAAAAQPSTVRSTGCTQHMCTKWPSESATSSVEPGATQPFESGCCPFCCVNTRLLHTAEGAAARLEVTVMH